MVGMLDIHFKDQLMHMQRDGLSKVTEGSSIWL